MIGIVIFLIGSALSGPAARTWRMLILFRGIQGIGAGALFPVALAIIGDLFTPQERGKYQGLFGAVFGIAFVVGPLVGGFLTENFGWHWIFYVNIPIGIVALFVIQRLLPTVKKTGRHSQLRLSSAARSSRSRSSFLLVGLTNKQTRRLGRADRRRLHPHRPRRDRSCSWSSSRAPRSRSSRSDLFRNRTYSASMVSTFFAALRLLRRRSSSCRAGSRSSEGYSPTDSGLAALPLMVGLIFSSIVVRLPRVADGPLQVAARRRDRRDGHRARCS